MTLVQVYDDSGGAWGKNTTPRYAVTRARREWTAIVDTPPDRFFVERWSRADPTHRTVASGSFPGWGELLDLVDSG